MTTSAAAGFEVAQAGTDAPVTVITSTIASRKTVLIAMTTGATQVAGAGIMLSTVSTASFIDVDAEI